MIWILALLVFYFYFYYFKKKKSRINADYKRINKKNVEKMINKVKH